MCGIVGIIGTESVADRLLDGLKRLEYRGYDSAGIATVEGGAIERRRASGKLKNLATELGQHTAQRDHCPSEDRCGWAAHDQPGKHRAEQGTDDRRGR